MGEETAPVFMMLMLVVGIATGLPFAFVIGASAIVSTIMFWGYHALPQMVFQTYKVLENFAFIAIPLFVLMAMILHKARLAEEMYDMMYKWSGPLRGGLAIGTEFICAVFAACTGIAGGTETAMGLVALPNMLKYKYAKSIALGSILTGGTLGQLIPPSILIVLYGIVTNVSVGKMFAGGLASGIVLVGLYSAYIFIRALINKDLCPALAPEERASWKEKFISLKSIKFLLIPSKSSIFDVILSSFLSSDNISFDKFFSILETKKFNASQSILLVSVPGLLIFIFKLFPFGQ